jgi:hypothetical protein
MSCSCNLAGMLSTNYDGIVSASLSGSTEVIISSLGLVQLGQTLSTLSITAYPFNPGGDRFLGVSCPASASAEIRWIQKYDCQAGITYLIPQSGGKASITGGPISGVYLECDPGIVSKAINASAQGGPVTPYIMDERRDGFNLVYTGGPIAIQSGSPNPYNISLGYVSLVAYLQSFSLSIQPPSPATVSYNFTVVGSVL